ncbi:MAG: hypothetical protein P1P83_07975 [Bacteroidales bacterium]|nr:hypothetical protein [Bacteroidales bacterium]MDT8373536.1 hypothetical protein [Bacteroidales bacterium]
MKNPKSTISLLFLFFLLFSSCDKGEILVETGDLSDILTTTAKITGNVICIGDGIKHYGHCYSVTPGPTVLDLKTEYYAAIGVGTYTSFLQGLEPGTRYYIRAYGRRDNIIAYGTEVSFTTASPVTP